MFPFVDPDDPVIPDGQSDVAAAPLEIMHGAGHVMRRERDCAPINVARLGPDASRAETNHQADNQRESERNREPELSMQFHGVPPCDTWF